jgi:hypothetical protein
MSSKGYNYYNCYYCIWLLYCMIVDYSQSLSLFWLLCVQYNDIIIWILLLLYYYYGCYLEEELLKAADNNKYEDVVRLLSEGVNVNYKNKVVSY